MAPPGVGLDAERPRLRQGGQAAVGVTPSKSQLNQGVDLTVFRLNAGLSIVTARAMGAKSVSVPGPLITVCGRAATGSQPSLCGRVEDADTPFSHQMRLVAVHVAPQEKMEGKV